MHSGEVMPNYYGYNAPFVGGSQNFMSRQEDIRLIKNDILQLLLTVPGDRVMRPSFGVNLRNVVFEQLDNNTISDLREEIADVISREEKRVVVENVIINRDNDNSLLAIYVVARLISDPTQVINVETVVRTT